MLEVDDINYESIQEFKKEILTAKPANEIVQPIVKIEAELDDFTPMQKAVVADWFIDENLETAKLTYKFYPKLDLTKWIIEKRTSINNLTQQLKESGEEFEKRKLDFIEFPIANYGFVILGGLEESKQADFYFLKALKFEFLDALRDAKTQLVASGDYRLLYKVLLNRGSNNYEAIKKTLGQLKKDVDENAELIEVKKEIKKFLDKTSLVEEEDHNAVDFSFSKPDENEMLKKLSLQYGNSPVTVERNGTGRNNLLYISLLLSHLIYKNIPEILFRLIAVEEPESHLHPQLQEHLAKNIQSEISDDRQIIITSHCPHITSKLELDNTVILFRNNQTIEGCYILDNFKDVNGNFDAEAEKHIRYLQRYLDATKSTMFFGRKIILVEGISEQIIIPKLFEIHTGKSIEKIGCTVVNVNGVAFKHFLEVVRKGFFIKCLVLTDSDTGTETEDRANNLQNDYLTDPELIKISITSESTFEKDVMIATKYRTKVT
jgi:putative ATP-dependent endonuclease of the OLD family